MKRIVVFGDYCALRRKVVASALRAAGLAVETADPNAGFLHRAAEQARIEQLAEGDDVLKIWVATGRDYDGHGMVGIDEILFAQMHDTPKDSSILFIELEHFEEMVRSRLERGLIPVLKDQGFAVVTTYAVLEAMASGSMPVPAVA